MTRRGYGNFGLLAAAGELAIQYDVLPMAPNDVLEAIAFCAENWRRGHSSTRTGPVAAFIRKLAELGPALQDWDTATVDASGYRRGKKIYLTAVAWADLCAETNSVAIARSLARMGALETQPGRFQAVHRHPVHGRPTRYYVIDARIAHPSEV